LSQFSSSKLTDKGRQFPARLTEANVATKTFTDPDSGESRDSTQLTLRFDRSDGRYELEFYRIQEDQTGAVSKRSDLGKLIEYFKKMGINDIGENDFEPILGGYYMVEAFPRTNRRTGEPNDKKFPTRRLTPEEIEQYFGAGAAGAQKPSLDKEAVFGEIKDEVLAAIDGLNQRAVLSKLALIPNIANHKKSDAIFEEITKGNLTKWLEEKGAITVDNGVISVVSNGS